jgi:hypothetical protein
LDVGLSWNHEALVDFRDVHGADPHVPPDAHARGRSISMQKYTEVRVGGVLSYWLIIGPLPSGREDPVQILDELSATKGGYVVSVASTNISESQDAHVLAAALNRI